MCRSRHRSPDSDGIANRESPDLFDSPSLSIGLPDKKSGEELIRSDLSEDCKDQWKDVEGCSPPRFGPTHSSKVQPARSGNEARMAIFQCGARYSDAISRHVRRG